ncbi:tRNA dihydrouridine(20/20a) synthase DusA [Reinekea marina]|uniref:tRNA-dihydrouridine(20/20a) synthase n=1 Tax=Reinekea marina TaxID=1310421 RepID=A0ABV7WWM5_9GAMM|nr:tRNA dihydrouridine(20/20a) synthase DusA [Reinekea marina]MDN3649712.1 tRNA dihydrouridine(20/20a) synthase DusA [Reinekea marina]
MTQTLYKHPFSVAPMMDWTTSECRQFHRKLTKNALLYTEMVTTGAIVHGDKERFLRFNPDEQPVSLQLGGHDPKDLATCSTLAQQWGYNEVNLNAGCPSDRVQNGMIGAILMAHSQIVGDGLKAMQDASDIEVTLKHRIGIDDMDSYDFMRDFVGHVHSISECRTFIVHARKAILQGLSPKENREIPPLDYDRVIKLKQDFPHLNIVINGGIKSHEDGLALMNKGLDGVMLGREAYQNPLCLRTVDSLYYGSKDAFESPQALNQALISWINQEVSAGKPLKYIARHMLGLYSGKPGSRQYRRYLSENIHKAESTAAVFEHAIGLIKVDSF